MGLIIFSVQAMQGPDFEDSVFIVGRYWCLSLGTGVHHDTRFRRFRFSAVVWCVTLGTGVHD